MKFGNRFAGYVGYRHDCVPFPWLCGFEVAAGIAERDHAVSVINIAVMLGADNHCVNSFWLAIVIFYIDSKCIVKC